MVSAFESGPFSGQPIWEDFGRQGEIHGRSWHMSLSEYPDLRNFHSMSETEVVPCRWLSARGSGEPLPLVQRHPGAYIAGDDLVAAVRTALVLGKPLVVTGNPGTGKSELAERIAYEFDLGPVLRFEAQSLSESGDLFYRFDQIAQMRAARQGDACEGRDAARFVRLGPLGIAILRSMPIAHRHKLEHVLGVSLHGQPCSSVVLVDEIDKASRDFPNDLLNGIDRMRFRIPELDGIEIAGAPADSPHRPIVIITSNSERELPAPFLRRCVFINIKDPSTQELMAIVRRRVFGIDIDPPNGRPDLPEPWARLIEGFVELRDRPTGTHHRISTAELIDWMTAAGAGRADVLPEGLPSEALKARLQDRLVARISAIAKHPGDVAAIREMVVDAFGLFSDEQNA